jgi:hypothetical protein
MLLKQDNHAAPYTEGAFVATVTIVTTETTYNVLVSTHSVCISYIGLGTELFTVGVGFILYRVLLRTPVEAGFRLNRSGSRNGLPTPSHNMSSLAGNRFYLQTRPKKQR